MTSEMDVPAHVTGSHMLFGATTLLMDRAVPAPERILLPPATSPPGRIRVTPDHAPGLPSTRSGLRALRHRLRRDRPPPPVGGPVVDMRAYAPQNWSHALMMHLPLCAVAAQVLGRPPMVVLPFRMPAAVIEAFSLCGLETIRTDGPVAGAACEVVCTDMSALKHAVVPIMADHARAIQRRAETAGIDLPRRVFVPRRGTRALSNQAEIEAVLRPLGFATVYPEALTVLEQFALFAAAEEVVAVHGAGLSPLCYRAPEAPPLTVVELLPAAHMTDFFRVVIDRLGGRYVAVRGRITAADAAAAYGDAPYVSHSLAPFHVDPASLELALREVDIASKSIR